MEMRSFWKGMELQLLHMHTYDIYLDIEINFLEQLIAETQKERFSLFRWSGYISHFVHYVSMCTMKLLGSF